jgi:MFS transporter, Spinster family, sphingosine-1-phosphate transporter
MSETSGYLRRMVLLLTLAYTVAFIDRQLLNLLVDPIKLDIIASDTAISLLQGFAFMGAFILFGPFFGRLADSGNRRNIIVGGVAAWSAFTVACGFADSFWSLFLARAAVGAAEACLVPAAWSLLSDSFSKDRLPRAMSFFLMGPYLGGGLALIFGGVVLGSAEDIRAALPVLASFEPWQLTFVLVGAPGLLLALVIGVWIREPVRRALAADQGASGPARVFTVSEVARFVWNGRAFFVRFYAGMALLVMVLYALPAWVPSYLTRNFAADRATLGLHYGTVVLVMGTVGVLCGPAFARWLARRHPSDSPVRTAMISALCLLPVAVALPLAPSYASVLACAGLATFFFSLPQALFASALQLATPNRMRGVISSLWVFIASVMGLGAAPTLVALITDHVFKDPTRVGASLGIVCGGAALGASYLIWRALPHYRAAVADPERFAATAAIGH